MTRTTLDIDKPLLDEVKRIQRRERRSLGQVVSGLLAEALASRRREQPPRGLEWTAKPMGARIQLADKNALYAILDDSEIH